MNTTISPNTQAILLLSAPLIVGKKGEPAPLLTLAEYNRFARSLREMGKEPADLLGKDAGALLEKCGDRFGKNRLEELLGRGFLLSQAVDRWHSRGIWVVSRADAAYPRRLKSRLREDAPPVLYGCGNPRLLDCGGLAVVGSRHVDEALVEYTVALGAMAADAKAAIVSGAARGIDSSAMKGALDAGGRVIGVMADSLERAALAKGNRDAFREGRLVVISAYDPAAGFNVGHAMQRNKAIYALSDAGLVVTSDFQKGGTWTGAIEQLEKLRYVPVFVRNGKDSGKGNQALIQHGGRVWPEPRNGDELADAMHSAFVEDAKTPQQVTFQLKVGEQEVEYRAVKEGALPKASKDVPEIVVEAMTPADELLTAVGTILTNALREPLKEMEIVELLGVTKPQAQAWLRLFLERGELEKLSKPVRYRAVSKSDRLI
jgi:predicted Rossmann fold nucleotide-binding protein DprA/Smf involved in DNA uptake